MSLTKESQFLNKYPNLKDVFALLRAELQKDGAQSYTTANAIRFKTSRVFAKAHFRKKHITLELEVGQRGLTDNYWASHPPEWGNTNVYPDQPIPGNVVKSIEIARILSAENP